VRVIVNGDAVCVDGAATVDELLGELGLGAKWVLVERNGEPVERASLATTPLAEGDRFEIVRAVAGG
jgi:sulfur carrier protein